MFLMPVLVMIPVFGYIYHGQIQPIPNSCLRIVCTFPGSYNNVDCMDYGLLQHYFCCVPLFVITYISSTEVFILTPQTSLNWRSDFLALGFFENIDGPGDIGLLLLDIVVVENIATLTMALYFYLSSHLTADFYNLLILSRHICFYNSILLNNWSTSIVTMCFSVIMNEIIL